MGDKPNFQTSEELCFDKVNGWFGQDCTWKKSGGDIKEEALFNDPTKDIRFNLVSGRGLNHVGYNNGPITMAFIEYRLGQFGGLFDLVYSEDENQYIVTGGIRYVTVKTETFFDGQTIHISLQKALTEAVVEQ